MEDNTSSDESSSSDYSTDSSDEDGFETALIGGQKVQLPQGLCERRDIFKEFFSAELWNSFPDDDKQHLQTFLPNFPENDELEKTKTLQRLFDLENFKFGNPLLNFHDNLKAGYFRPDIARMRKIIRKAQKKEAKYRYQSYREQLKNEILESQERLLYQVRNLPPGVEPKPEKRKINVDYVSHRTKKRYFQILASIRAKVEDTDCSSDENYPEGPPSQLSRKQKRHLNSIKNSLNANKDKMFGSTMVAKLNGFTMDLEKYITPNYNPFYVNDDMYKNLLYEHKKRKLEYPFNQELNTRGITMTDIINRTQLPYIKNLPTKPPASETKLTNRKRIKKEAKKSVEPPVKINNSSNSDTEDSDSIIDAVTVMAKKKPRLSKHVLMKIAPTPKAKADIKKEVVTESVVVKPCHSPIPSIINNNPSINTHPLPPFSKIKIEDIEKIDIMNTPIDLQAPELEILDVKPELMQDTHANFFSLIRDVICSTSEHRMNMYTLQERLKSWQENPISPLNDWYSYTDNWIGILPSAITFLCGNASEQPDDFVPYMEYKITLDVYQWIGAGRDSDSLLSALCNFWLEHRSEAKILSPMEVEVEVTDRTATPPPPRCPTSWTVRKATQEEIQDFREQERKRYNNPHKAFTYRCNGYESVVGPLKGIYNSSSGNAKARGHTMLNADRPNFVTILSLVRDATARLPNGEGTRADICELLKSSQYISSTAPDNILQSVVSGALDRMHTQWDPCVKYDAKRKIWIYLHRHRTEEDFERIHQQYQGLQKTKKPATKKSPVKPKTPKGEKSVKTVKVIQPPVTAETTQEQQEQAQKQQEQQQKPPPKKERERSRHTVRRVVPPPPPPKKEERVKTVSPQLPEKTSSLLISNNMVKIREPEKPVEVENTPKPPKQNKQEEVQVKTPAKSQMVKILSPSQGKSLIIPGASKSHLIKQIQEHCSTSKQMNQVVTQQLLQTIATQQKQIMMQKVEGAAPASSLDAVTKQEKLKAAQQFLQGMTPQQVQNMKNMTLLRQQPPQNIVTISQQAEQPNADNIVTVAVSSKPSTSQNEISTASVQVKTQTNLTAAQQQQLLQTLKQKVLPAGNMLTPQQQQFLLKQKGVVQVQKQAVTQKIAMDSIPKTVSSPQGPVVAKVLTNAAGQVISVESLLAHQKQHGSLPQGTTLRVQSTKSGQQNIIHLTGASKPNPQFSVGPPNNIAATLTTQPKLIAASQTANVAATTIKSQPRAVKSQQVVPKVQPVKISPQTINARPVDGQKKSGPRQVPNAIRMLNANLNLTTIGGKPVLLASKPHLQGQSVVLQAQQNAAGPSLVLQNAVKGATAGGIIGQGNIVFGPPIQKGQVAQQVVLANAAAKAQQPAQAAAQQPGHIVLGGQPIRLQAGGATAASATQRVVLASQGQGGQIVAQQILLPAGFQGTAINIKALQGVKVIPIAQATGKGGQSRQVFARVMNPNLLKQAASSPGGASTSKAPDSTNLPNLSE